MAHISFEKGGELATDEANFVISYTDDSDVAHSLAELFPQTAYELGLKLRRLYPTPPAR